MKTEVGRRAMVASIILPVLRIRMAKKIGSASVKM
jgi:hypothetical protein